MTLFEAARERQGLSQAQLAAALGVDRSFISFIERGERPPSADVLDRLCDVLGFTAEERSEALRLAAEAARARRAQAEPSEPAA
jgi:transcriptional regulator with XRE-family HTH domain